MNSSGDYSCYFWIPDFQGMMDDKDALEIKVNIEKSNVFEKMHSEKFLKQINDVLDVD